MTVNIRVMVRMDDLYTQQKIINALSEHLSGCEIITDNSIGDVPTGDDIPLLYWMEYEDIPWDQIVANSFSATNPNNNGSRSGRLHANSYCIRKGLIRKAQQAYIIRKHVTKRPQSVLCHAFPETYQMEADHPDYLDELLNEMFEVREALECNAINRLQLESCTASTDNQPTSSLTTFIMKPSMTNKGAGIYLFDSFERFEEILEDIYDDGDDDSNNDDDDDDDEYQALSMVREWIVQRYIDNPLLLNGDKKFHIRAYVLAVGNCKVYLFDQMLALFALHSYTNSSLEDRLAHLTNTCLQSDHEKDRFEEIQSVMQFWELSELFPDQISRVQLEGIFRDMQEILGELFEATCAEVVNFQPLPGCFELYGMDFLVDSQMKVWFLEANAYPDFKQTGDRLSGLIQRLFNETVRTAVKPLLQQGGEEVDSVRSDIDQLGTGRMRLVYSKTK